GLEQGVEADGIRIRERGLVADDGAHPDALVDRIAARLDDAFLEAPAFAAGVLEVQVGVVDTVVENLGERTLQVRFVEPGRLEQDGSGLGQSGQGWICDFHTPMLQQAPPDSAGARAWRDPLIAGSALPAQRAPRPAARAVSPEGRASRPRPRTR